MCGEVDRKSAQIVADIVFKTTKGVFIIPGISWFISQIQRQGETERKSFQAVSIFSTGRDQRRVYAADSRSRGNGKENHL